MTETEALEFVQAEIKPRYRSLNDVQTSDWITVARLTDLSTARAVVKGLVTQGETVSTKGFVTALRQRQKPHPTAPKEEPPRFSPYLRCLEAPPTHPSWQGRAWYRTDGLRPEDQTSEPYVLEFITALARQLQAEEGGRWCGEIRPALEGPSCTTRAERREIDAHIIAGPDSPGRRFLLRLRTEATPPAGNLVQALAATLPTVPRETPPMTTASRKLLDALAQLPAHPTARPQILNWSSENLDPLPTAPRPREPGEDDEKLGSVLTGCDSENARM